MLHAPKRSLKDAYPVAQKWRLANLSNEDTGFVRKAVRSSLSNVQVTVFLQAKQNGFRCAFNLAERMQNFFDDRVN